MVLQALDRDAAEGRTVRGEMAAELRKSMEALSGVPDDIEELRQHILHMRREITRNDRSTFPERQRLAGKVTRLLDGLLLSLAPSSPELHGEFQASGQQNYVHWLEAQLAQARGKI